MSKKQSLLFVHGAQGSGKSTLTNLLREKLTHTTLMRLAGVPADQEDPNTQALRYHVAMLEAVNQAYGTGMNFIFDRSYLCEKVYANLGFKEHSFDKELKVITSGMKELSKRYNIYFVLLTASKEVFQQRLKREGKTVFEGIEFDAQNSINQQEEYLNEFEDLPEDVGVLILPTNDMSTEELAQFIIEAIKEEDEDEETNC